MTKKEEAWTWWRCMMMTNIGRWLYRFRLYRPAYFLGLRAWDALVEGDESRLVASQPQLFLTGVANATRLLAMAGEALGSSAKDVDRLRVGLRLCRKLLPSVTDRSKVWTVPEWEEWAEEYLLRWESLSGPGRRPT